MSNLDSRETGVLAGALALVAAGSALMMKPGSVKNIAKGFKGAVGNAGGSLAKGAKGAGSNILKLAPDASDLKSFGSNIKLSDPNISMKSLPKEMPKYDVKSSILNNKPFEYQKEVLPKLKNKPNTDSLVNSILEENNAQKKIDAMFKNSHKAESVVDLSNINKAKVDRAMDGNELRTAMDAYGGIKKDLINATKQNPELEKYEKFFTNKYDKYGVFGKNDNAKKVYDSFMGIDDELGFLLDKYKSSGSSKAEGVENLIGNINERFKSIGLNKVDSGGIRGSYLLNGDLLRNAQAM